MPTFDDLLELAREAELEALSAALWDLLTGEAQ